MWLKIISFYLVTLFTSFSFITFATSPYGGGKEVAKEFLKAESSPAPRVTGASLPRQKGEMTEVFKTTGK
jgi:hypothetical protein